MSSPIAVILQLDYNILVGMFNKFVDLILTLEQILKKLIISLAF